MADLNSHEAVTLIAEACGGWVRLSRRADIYYKSGFRMAYDGHLTIEGAHAALVMAMGRDGWEVSISNTHPLTGKSGGLEIETYSDLFGSDWPEGKPMDADTIRDVVAEALALEAGR